MWSKRRTENDVGSLRERPVGYCAPIVVPGYNLTLGILLLRCPSILGVFVVPLQPNLLKVVCSPQGLHRPAYSPLLTHVFLTVLENIVEVRGACIR
jgi:hypothetical protein